MKTAKLYGKEDIRVEEVAVPEIREDEVLVQVKASFICGTDVRMYKNGKPGIDETNPRVLGHEIAGVVEKVGARVSGYKPGMRAAIAPNYGCGICDTCISGNTQMCKEAKALGVTVDGGFAEYIKIPARAVRQGNITPIADHISFEEAALAEPLSCVYNAFQRIGIFPGDKVLVIGAGPIGIMHARIAVMAGASRVFINDLSEERLELAKKLVPSITPISGDVKEELEKLTNGKLADVVITAASVKPIQEAAFALAGLNGRIMFFGGLPKGNSIVSLDTNEIHYKQLTISGTTMQSLEQFRECLKLIEEGSIKVSDLVTSSSSLDNISEVISNVAAGKGLKSVITN
ncbi:MAG: alcohol dehydrogenase catalytic domain-containing protein [Spirochaetales bacterium]|nr:alcohol dehydrogenase catalytic domain-containing protein [Spirochaetales bacterium]